MSNEHDLNDKLEAHLQAIWKGGSAVQPTWAPEQIQVRAVQFEKRSRKMALADQLSFLLVPLIVVGSLLALDVRSLSQQSFGRIQLTGAALLVLCSIVGFLASRHSYAVVISDANDLLASHLERLARLRDWYASTAWGAAMFLPGLALVVIGVGMNPTGRGWELPIIYSGIAAFVYIVACVQTRLKARWLQREIDSLAAIRR